MDVQHTYRIRHKGVESTPHSLAELRQMWRASQIDSSTEFKRGDSPVWLDANDLLTELQLERHENGTGATGQTATFQSLTARPGAARELAQTAPSPVRLVSARIPFREVFILVLKFYAASLLLALILAAAWLALERYAR